MTDSSAGEHEHPLGSVAAPLTFAFLDFELHVPSAEIRRAGEPVALSAQSFALLLHLLRNHARVVGREELSAQLWPGVTVGEGSLRQAVWELRQVLGDTASEPRAIKTFRGRGYRFVAALRAPLPRASEPPRPKAMFGRAPELERLQSALRESRHGVGRACVVAGAPGVGKSRLAQELTRSARAAALPVYEAYAVPDGAAPPLWPWLSLLTQVLAQTSAPARDAQRRSAPLVFQLLEGTSVGCRIEGLELREDTPAQQRFQLTDELAGAFCALLGEQPSLLLLEDAQWADETSLAFLGHFISVLPRTRALLVVTSRTVPRKQNRALARALEALGRGAFSERLELDNLTPEDVRAMLEAHAREEVAPALAADVHALSLGNPLFALELARLLAQYEPEQRRSCLHQRVEVHTVIRRRLEALPEAALDAVHAASVLSREFGLAELAGVLGEAPRAALARLDACRESGVLRECAADGRYCFAHPLVRDAAYACLGPARRMALHLAAGEWLERRAERAGPSCIAELAHHFFAAAALGAAAKAIHYATLCAKHAYDATAYASAVSYYDRALTCGELLADCDPSQRLELELARGEALRASGEPAARVNQVFLEIARRASALGRGELFARAALGYAGQRSARFTPTRFVTSVSAEELDLLSRALHGLGDTHDELRVLLLCALVFALIYSVDRPRRERLASEALALARRHGSGALIARALQLQIYACAAPDAHEQRLAACHELVAVAHAHGLKEAQVLGHVSRALCLLAVGDAHGVQQDETRARLLAEELGVPRVIVRSRLIALLRAFSAGELAEAERLSNQALEVAKDDVSEQMLHMVRMAALRVFRTGDPREVVTLNEGLLASHPDALACRCTLASAYAALGQPELALRHFDWVARDDFAHVPEDIVWMSEMLSLADAAVALNDAPRARLIYDKLAPHGDVFAVFAGGAAPAGPVAYTLGMLATTLQDYERAARWLAKAQALNQRVGAHLFTQICALAEARLIFRAWPWEAPRARALLDASCSFAEQRGIVWMRYYADNVRSEAPRDGGGVRIGLPRLREAR